MSGPSIGVGLDEVDDAVHQGVLQALLHGRLPPREVHRAAPPGPVHRLGEGDEPVRGVAAPVEEHILDQLEQVGGDVLVDRELSRVDDAHIEPGAYRVEEERRVHRLAHDIIATERERQVGDAAAGPHPRAALLDQRQSVHERLRVAVVLGDAGRDREHVRVEDDVFGREAGLLREQVIGAAADRHLAFGGVGLALLVEGHHHHPGAVVPDVPGLLEERAVALLQADRVDHALALQALEPGLQHAPPRTVDHDRDTRDLGLGCDQVQ